MDDRCPHNCDNSGIYNLLENPPYHPDDASTRIQASYSDPRTGGGEPRRAVSRLIGALLQSSPLLSSALQSTALQYQTAFKAQKEYSSAMMLSNSLH